MKTKKLVIVKGKGTPKETRIQTNITLYFSPTLNQWITVPEGDNK